MSPQKKKLQGNYGNAEPLPPTAVSPELNLQLLGAGGGGGGHGTAPHHTRHPSVIGHALDAEELHKDIVVSREFNCETLLTLL